MADRQGLRVVIDLDGSPILYSEVLTLWQQDDDFRAFFIAFLADSPFSAFRWETPSLTKTTADRPFEFVLLDSPELATKADSSSFAEHFRKGAKNDVIEFPNLGKNAVLVGSCPLGPQSAYGHLAAFVRHAPEAQQHALWKLVGEAMVRRLGAKPVWLSTAGAGVPWLHVRLDDSPKYYGHGPYRR